MVVWCLTLPGGQSGGLVSHSPRRTEWWSGVSLSKEDRVVVWCLTLHGGQSCGLVSHSPRRTELWSGVSLSQEDRVMLYNKVNAGLHRWKTLPVVCGGGDGSTSLINSPLISLGSYFIALFRKRSMKNIMVTNERGCPDNPDIDSPLEPASSRWNPAVCTAGMERGVMELALTERGVIQ